MMTSGEKMVWAIAFVQRRAGRSREEAAAWAAREVGEMRRCDHMILDNNSRAMLDDMLKDTP